MFLFIWNTHLATFIFLSFITFHFHLLFWMRRDSNPQPFYRELRECNIPSVLTMDDVSKDASDPASARHDGV